MHFQDFPSSCYVYLNRHTGLASQINITLYVYEGEWQLLLHRIRPHEVIVMAVIDRVITNKTKSNDYLGFCRWPVLWRYKLPPEDTGFWILSGPFGLGKTSNYILPHPAPDSESDIEPEPGQKFTKVTRGAARIW